MYTEPGTTREPGGLLGSKLNLRPDTWGKRPSSLGHMDTPFSSALMTCAVGRVHWHCTPAVSTRLTLSGVRRSHIRTTVVCKRLHPLYPAHLRPRALHHNGRVHHGQDRHKVLRLDDTLRVDHVRAAWMAHCNANALGLHVFGQDCHYHRRAGGQAQRPTLAD
jgi:hypothetical protein